MHTRDTVPPTPIVFPTIQKGGPAVGATPRGHRPASANATLLALLQTVRERAKRGSVWTPPRPRQNKSSPSIVAAALPRVPALGKNNVSWDSSGDGSADVSGDVSEDLTKVGPPPPPPLLPPLPLGRTSTPARRRKPATPSLTTGGKVGSENGAPESDVLRRPKPTGATPGVKRIQVIIYTSCLL